jgi:hypothetical protein
MERLSDEMNMQKNHEQESWTVSFDEAIDLMVEHLLADVAGAVPHLMLGPVVWQIPAGSDRQQWYFVVGSGGRDGFWCDQLGGTGKADTAKIREAVRLRLLQSPPIVVHDFDDELEMAKWCEAIWPCAMTTEIRTTIEAERRCR